jgi:pyridinium-3,5-biscarboxylic acid mononucleotide synthase
MTSAVLQALLADVRSGASTPEAAHERILQYLRQAPFEDLGFARVDHHRAVRQGCPEVVFGPGKSPNQVATIAERIVAAGHSLLVTRTDRAAYDAVSARLSDAKFHEVARTITLTLGELPPGRGTIVVAAAGTADLAVAEEAAVCAELMGNTVDRLYDVGIAGLHRILDALPRLTTARVIIVVAGMEGALPSVVGGLVAVPVIAVPTSVGYGASFGGIAALLGMLNSCASGVSVVNIDNGFGAAAIASSINHLA